MFRIALLIFMVPLGAQAADGSDVPCERLEISAEVDACAEARRRAADRLLNETYRRLLAQVDDSYRPAPELGAELKAAIRKAQRAWIQYRDANCAVQAFEAEPGTAAHRTTVSGCVTEMTAQRTLELSRMLNGYTQP